MPIHLKNVRARRSLPSRKTWISVDWKNKLFLTLAFCISAPAFGMRHLTKLRQPISNMSQRMIHSGSHQPQLWKIEYIGEKADRIKLIEQVYEIEMEVWSVIDARPETGKFVRYDDEHQWLDAKKKVAIWPQ